MGATIHVSIGWQEELSQERCNGGGKLLGSDDEADVLRQGGMLRRDASDFPRPSGMAWADARHVIFGLLARRKERSETLGFLQPGRYFSHFVLQDIVSGLVGRIRELLLVEPFTVIDPHVQQCMERVLGKFCSFPDDTVKPMCSPEDAVRELFSYTIEDLERLVAPSKPQNVTEKPSSEEAGVAVYDGSVLAFVEHKRGGRQGDRRRAQGYPAV